MSAPRYQIIYRAYNLDKTVVSETLRPKLYKDVDSANSAALEWVRIFRCSSELAVVKQADAEGLRTFAANSFKGEKPISAEAEVVRAREAKGVEKDMGRLTIIEGEKEK